MTEYSDEEKAERRADYKRYLKSTMWKAIRGTALLRANFACERCKGTDILQVHHLKYPQVFGTETPEMLQVLCDPCHAEAHGQPYIIHKLDRAKRAARRQRLRDQKRELREAAQAVKKAKRAARAKRWNPDKTLPLKDRFSVFPRTP